jgi:uncharacterized protein YehS (DUF1456 family)
VLLPQWNNHESIIVTNNDILRSIRYMLDLSDIRVAELAQLADAELVIEKEEVQRYLKKEDDPDYLNCRDRVLACFLDGLVIHRRGRSDQLPARPVESRMTNNIVLKKLRVAFELKDLDMHAIFSETGFPVSKPELSALFRQPGHKHYRACGDQILRNFLKGLTARLRKA